MTGSASDRQTFVERHLHGPPAAFLIPLRSRVVDEDAPHETGRHREEVRAILPVDLLDVDQAQVRLVDERGRLKAVPCPFAGHAPAGDAAQFAVDDRNEPIERRLVALPHCQEEPRHIGGVKLE